MNLENLLMMEYYIHQILYENIAKKSGQGPSYIKALCLNIIHDCNLRCKYCFADEGEYHGCRKAMSPEVGKKKQ